MHREKRTLVFLCSSEHYRTILRHYDPKSCHFWLLGLVLYDLIMIGLNNKSMIGYWLKDKIIHTFSGICWGHNSCWLWTESHRLSRVSMYRVKPHISKTNPEPGLLIMRLQVRLPQEEFSGFYVPGVLWGCGIVWDRGYQTMTCKQMLS